MDNIALTPENMIIYIKYQKQYKFTLTLLWNHLYPQTRLVPPHPLWHNIILILSIILTFMTFAKEWLLTRSSSNTVSESKHRVTVGCSKGFLFLIGWYVNKPFHLKQKKTIFACPYYLQNYFELVVAGYCTTEILHLPVSSQMTEVFSANNMDNCLTSVGYCQPSALQSLTSPPNNYVMWMFLCFLWERRPQACFLKAQRKEEKIKSKLLFHL